MKKLVSLAIIMTALVAAGCSADTNSNTYTNANASRTDAANTAAREKGEAVNGATISDATITSKIKVKFVADGIVGTNVDIVNGEVTLTGTVDDDAEKAKAEKIANETEGVKSVKNELTIEKK